MAHLSLSFLGGFGVNLDAEPITAFGADKVRALLAYLAIDSSHPHPRAELAAMFWPDSSEKSAAHNLSQTLLRLRQALRTSNEKTIPSFLLSTTQDVQFNEASDWKLDVTRFRALLNMCNQHEHADTARCEVCFQWLLEAAELYRGDLLQGLFVEDSVAFEEWRLVQQEELHGQALETLKRLVAYYEQRGDYEKVQVFARRQIALEPWREEAHLQLMRALGRRGQTSTALRQYETYEHMLADELGIKPSAEATAFYEQIRAGEGEEQVVARSGVGEATWLSNQGERRQVTALVCSHVTSGDSEQIQEQFSRCEQQCAAIFNRFGGRRMLRHGDACLVYFGYPQAYEDAARRAVHSGLEVTAALGETEPVRIGIHTGLMTVGEKRGRRWQDRDLIGRIPDIARDCQRVADRSEVLLSEDTRRLVQEYFELQEWNSQGRNPTRNSLTLYRALGENRVQNRLEWLAQTQRLTSFTGRTEEQAQLKAAHELILQSHGQILLLKGESGIGKSRLIWEFQKSIPIASAQNTTPQGNPTPVLWFSSHCLLRNQNTSLLPLIGLIEGLLHFHPDDSQDLRREKLIATLTSYNMKHPSAVWLLSVLLGLPTDISGPETVTKAQRDQMRELSITLLKKRAAEQPIVLVIEDLHWADPSTLEWLRQSIDALSTIRCLVLLTARPSFNPTWLSHTNLPPNLQIISLGPLSTGEAEELVFHLAGRDTLDETTRRRIVSHTDGIPLFIEETTKALLESGATNATMEISPTLIDSLVARLDHLGGAKEIAQWAAALGREFSYSVLQACTPYDEEHLQGSLARLIEAELVTPVHDNSHSAKSNGAGALKAQVPLVYTFRHALVQEAAYASMLKKTREVYHRRIAETLEIHFPQLAETQPEILAQHYSAAGLQTRAFDFWIQAGEHAIAQGAALEAKAFFNRILEEVEPEDRQRRWQALLGRETALFYQGEREAQKTDIAALLELAEILNDNSRRAQVQIRQARYTSSQSDYRGQLEAAEAAIAMAERANAIQIEVEALAYKLTALMRLGERATLQETVEQTLARVQDVGDDPIQTYTMAAVAIYYIEAGDLSRAIQCLVRSLESSKCAPAKHLDLESQYYGHLGFAYAQLGLYAQAREALEAGLELATLIGMGRYQAYHKLNLGFVSWRLGDLDIAIQMEEEVLKEYTLTGEAFGEAASQAYLGFICEAAGKLDLAAKYLADARTGLAKLGVDPDKFEAQAVEARVVLAQGQTELAQQLVDEAWKYLCENGTDGLGSSAWIYVCIADVLDAVEVPGISARDVIETGYRELMQRAEKISDPGWRLSFLENVAENRTILERWKNMNKAAACVCNG